MLIGLWIRDVVLIEALDLAVGPGLTALTGETGAGKSIILDALGLATGARAEAGLVRRGAAQAGVSAVFAPAPGHAVWEVLEEKGLSFARDEDLTLRRTLAADGRSRAFVNDQPTSAGVLREIAAHLLEVHGQHETVGLLDARTHRGLLDGFGGLSGDVAATTTAWGAWRAAEARRAEVADEVCRAAAEAGELADRLADLDRLAARAGEETALADERALLGAAERTLADIAAARDALGGDTVITRLAKAARALEHALDRALKAGATEETPAVQRITAAAAVIERALVECHEIEPHIDAAARAFDFDPGQLEKTEERLFELRAAARRLNVLVDDLPAVRVATAERLALIEDGEAALRAASAAAQAARDDYDAKAAALSAARAAAATRLTVAVAGELAPLKLDKARFEVSVEPEPEDRAGPQGRDRVRFQIATVPGAPLADLGTIASGGELARLALALKASLSGRGEGAPPLMIFDEVDQGVGGAVADAVGLRLQRLAKDGQVVVVTHSPQVAARADAHWRVAKAGEGERLRTAVETLSPAAREEELARMLAGAEVTDAARAAARALREA